jgi:hypothetical protein
MGLVYGFDIDLTQASALRTAVAQSEKACVINRAAPPHDLVAINSKWTQVARLRIPSLALASRSGGHL